LALPKIDREVAKMPPIKVVPLDMIITQASMNLSNNDIQNVQSRLRDFVNCEVKSRMSGS
jgi:hypothetical protein